MNRVIDAIARRPWGNALALIPLLLLCSCEFDTYEPDIDSSIRWRTVAPPPMPFHDLVITDSEMIVATGACALMSGDGRTWESIGPDWSGPMQIRYLAADGAGNVYAVSQWGGLAVRRGGVWQEIPFEDAHIHGIALDPEGTLWVCGVRNGALLARLIGDAWEILPTPSGFTELDGVVALGPDHAVVLWNFTGTVRFQGGVWTWLEGGAEASELWGDGQSEILEQTSDGLVRLQGDAFVPVDDSFPDGSWNAVDVLPDGTLAVGGYDGAVAIRRDGVWSEIPIPESISIDSSVSRVRRLVLDTPTSLFALTGRHAFHWDGDTWTALSDIAPRLRGFYRDNDPTEWMPEPGVCGDEGTVASLPGTPPSFNYWYGLKWVRSDVVAATYTSNGPVALTRDRHTCGINTRLSTHVARADYRAITAGTSTMVVAVGDAGMIRQGYGGLQQDVDAGVTVDLHDVWCSVSDGMWWAVGDEGTLLFRHGSRWDPAQQITDRDLRGVWGRGPDEVYVAGAGGLVMRWDGAQWLDMACPLESDLLAIAGSPVGSLWVVGRGGAAAYHDGEQWHEVAVPRADDLVDVCVPSHRRAFLMTADGEVVEYMRTNP